MLIELVVFCFWFLSVVLFTSMSDRIVFLSNLTRQMTDEEYEEFSEYFHNDEENELIGGPEHIIGGIFNEVERNNSSTNQREDEADSDESDLEGPYAGAEPLQDARYSDLVLDVLNADTNNDDVAQASGSFKEPAAIEPNRGQKYEGQGKFDHTVWWSMPSSTEKARTCSLKNKRMHSKFASTITAVDKIEAFNKILSSEIIDCIVLETNRKAKRIISNNKINDPKIQQRPWSNTTAAEIRAFFGILLYAGAEKSNLVQAKDLFHKSHMAFYRAVMSLERFEQLARFLRFDDSRTRAARLLEDKLAPFRHVWTLFQSSLRFGYLPSKELTIDEQLLTSRNRCPFRQYIPSKPGKYGIKIFWLVDAENNYPLTAEIYLGTQPNAERSTGIAHELVMRLSKPFLNTGANITMDNFFTSYPLAKDLITKHGTTIVGTIRSNKREIPALFAKKEESKKRGPLSSVFCFSDEISLVSFTTHDANKNVLLLSTAHATEEINDRTSKPIIIHDYNDKKGGVDTFDKMLRGYTCKRKSNRWPMACFYNMIDVAALAAYRLYELGHPNWNTNKSEKRKVFLKELAMELVQGQLDNRSKKPLKQSVKIAMDLINYTPKTNLAEFPVIQVIHMFTYDIL